MAGVFGACMFYGDAIITVEGLEVISPDLTHYVVPITIIILLALFLIQKTGTDIVGRLFGPIMVIWFATIGLMGLQ